MEWLTQNRKYLVGLLLVLVFVVLGELGVLYLKSRQSKKSADFQEQIAVSQVASSIKDATALPLSSPDKKGAKLFTPTNKDVIGIYTTWSDGDFYYYRKKESSDSAYPYLFRGIVRSVQGSAIAAEATTADKSKYLVKVKLLDTGKVFKNYLPATIKDVTVGVTAQFSNLRQDLKDGEYFLIKKISVFAK